jgi:hypothetical protein
MRHPLHLKLQAIAGVVCFGVFLYLGWVQKLEPFHTYFYLFAWIPFLWVIDRTLASRTGASLLDTPRSFLWMLWLSTTFWLFFEMLNFRLNNWQYLDVPLNRLLRWSGYALSFATVLPGILILRKLIGSYLPKRGARDTELGRRKSLLTEPPSPAFRAPHSALGFLMLVLPMLWPEWLFPLVWGGVFLILDPWVARKKGHSLILDWKQGTFRYTGTLLAAGLVCGLFWEGCNFGAGAKWEYTLPYWEFSKIFEMPLLGFIGFMPFALEAHAFHQAACIVWRERTSFQRGMILCGGAVFWRFIFEGIDRYTVVSWR